MQRLLVVILAAVDAVIAAAVGLVVLLAPLTLLWVLAVGGGWGALWPTTGVLWQFGYGVPVQIEVPLDVVTAVGIAPEAASFALSVAPLALLMFTLLFAARSGTRAARSGAGLTGAGAGTLAFGLLSVAVALTARLDVATTPLWMGILLPPLVYAVGAVAGAVRYAWVEGDAGPIDRLHDIVDGWGEWGLVPGAAVRGAATALVALLGLGGIAVAVMSLVRGGEAVALFESARVDALGVVVIALGQLAYLPTLWIWAVAWLAGPGFALGAGTAVSPAGTQLGVVPGIPVLGLVPETDSFWTLIVVLAPVGAGAFAGWLVRSRLVADGPEPALLPRAGIAAGIAALTAGVAALATWLASGSIGPGRLAEVGPHPGFTALALGIEVLVGAGILLLSPRHRDELAEERTRRWIDEMGASPIEDPHAGASRSRDDVADATADRGPERVSAAARWSEATDEVVPDDSVTEPLGDDLGPLRDGGTGPLRDGGPAPGR